MDTIQSITRQEIRDFIYNPIYPVEGWSFNQYDTVKRIHLYLNSQFEDKSLFHGREKIFYNITNNRRDAVARFLDVDVKDVVFDEINPQSEIALQLIKAEWLRFAEKNRISKKFNELSDEAVSYGSVALYVKPKGEPEVLDLRKLFLDPTVDCITDSRFVSIKYTLTHQQLRDKIKDGWDKLAIERLIERNKSKSQAPESYQEDGNINQIISSGMIDVYVRYGYLPKYLVDGSGEDEIMSLAIIGEPLDTSMIEGQVSEEHGEVLFKSKWTKDLPFKDYHFTKTKGRWLGIGVPEILFAPQERFNELMNQRRVGMEISQLHLFQTADPTVLNNILTDLENGDVIRTKVQGSIQPIVNEERNLPAGQQEEQSWTMLSDKLSHANDLLSGGDVPSSTPATNVVVQNNNQVLVHLQKRENFCIFLAEYIKEHVVPQLIKEGDGKHFLKIMGDSQDLAFIDDKIIEIEIMNEVMRRALEDGEPTYITDRDEIKKKVEQDLAKKGGKRFIEVLDKYYSSRLSDIIVHIDNEKKDIAKIANNTLQFFQLTQGIDYSDPVNKLFLTQYGKEIGLDIGKMEMAFAKRESVIQEAQIKAETQASPQQGNPETENLAKVL